ncbi:MAG: preprotein translocase subunit SecG [candidate division Zixibacteria bacterium]|nr:preprotein translocase subunit SecG [candidate division Zixibacteria bacterium]
MFTLLLIIHIMICVALIIVVLLQSSKGEGLAGAFGGGGGVSGAVFGGRGAASFLSRSTSVLAVVFMVSCLGLSLLSTGQRSATATTEVKSAVTEAAQQDMARQQQQQATQQQAPAPAGDQTANPEDIFNQSATGQKPDSGK